MAVTSIYMVFIIKDIAIMKQHEEVLAKELLTQRYVTDIITQEIHK